nr:hypothetical protein [Nostoc parmelioides]
MPPFEIIFPPTNAIVLVGKTRKPVKLLRPTAGDNGEPIKLCPTPSIRTAEGLLLNCSPIGVVMVSIGVTWVWSIVNSKPSANLMLFAVLPIKEPPTFSWAF